MVQVKLKMKQTADAAAQTRAYMKQTQSLAQSDTKTSTSSSTGRDGGMSSKSHKPTWAGFSLGFDKFIDKEKESEHKSSEDNSLSMSAASLFDRAQRAVKFSEALQSSLENVEWSDIVHLLTQLEMLSEGDSTTNNNNNNNNTNTNGLSSSSSVLLSMDDKQLSLGSESLKHRRCELLTARGLQESRSGLYSQLAVPSDITSVSERHVSVWGRHVNDEVNSTVLPHSTVTVSDDGYTTVRTRVIRNSYNHTVTTITNTTSLTAEMKESLSLNRAMDKLLQGDVWVSAQWLVSEIVDEVSSCVVSTSKLTTTSHSSNSNANSSNAALPGSATKAGASVSANANNNNNNNNVSSSSASSKEMILKGMNVNISGFIDTNSLACELFARR